MCSAAGGGVRLMPPHPPLLLLLTEGLQATGRPHHAHNAMQMLHRSTTNQLIKGTTRDSDSIAQSPQ